MPCQVLWGVGLMLKTSARDTGMVRMFCDRAVRRYHLTGSLVCCKASSMLNLNYHTSRLNQRNLHTESWFSSSYRNYNDGLLAFESQQNAAKIHVDVSGILRPDIQGSLQRYLNGGVYLSVSHNRLWR